MEDHNAIVEKVKEFTRQYQSDAKFKAQVDADPAAALRSKGCGNILPKAGSVKVHHDDAKTIHIVFPSVSVISEASDEALDQVSGGDCAYTSTAAGRSNNYYYHPGGWGRPRDK